MNPCFQLAVHGIHAEFSRIKIIFQPLNHILVIRVLGIGNRGQQVIIPKDAATIFWRTGVLPRGADRMPQGRIWWEYFIDKNFVQPTVTEIIFMIWPHSGVKQGQNGPWLFL